MANPELVVNRAVRLSRLIATSFYGLYHLIKQGAYTHWWLKGGRGSTKSSFISIVIILGIMRHRDTHAVVLRKVAANLKDSIYEQLLWAIDVLGVGHLWKAKLSPLELIYIPTGQRIIFRGADKPRKIKSIKVKKGYIRWIWYEEVDEFNGPDEIRIINQSLMRGGPKFDVFYSFNPPRSVSSWVNTVVLEKRPDTYVHHSTYLDVPREWLGEQFIIEAEHLKAVNEAAYEHEYLGVPNGTGGEVFTNVKARVITDEEIARFDRIYRGLDFGFASDPLHYTVCYFDKTRRRLFIFYEIHRVGMKNRHLVDAIKQENPNNRLITADSAEQRTIAELRELGLNVRGAKKGPDSVEHGIKFLQDLEEIIIDPVRCPNTLREFTQYELEKDANGNWKDGFPDRNNHSIDAVRYALEDEINMRTVRAAPTIAR
ncbi:MAG: terminase [Candidatus Reconcilbacillus cellulovorans]|uniref:Terminase n=1 Tax=Candidatus Reconcilbacillus cellulovorans TaxID=1906605 RepID=A0A2A6E3L7_9BACL|nr:MAG: terminase [Candidatus Reconcilbacillus cellulovorans]